jgi:choline dehydrogenase-like flavoprotein
VGTGSEVSPEQMSESFDFIVVGGGSAGAVIAARLSEDPACRVALLEAGERPPDVELMPVACAAMLNPATDWMYTADPGKAGLGLNGRRVPVPRGKMLGGILRTQLHGVCARSSWRLRLLGGGT